MAAPRDDCGERFARVVATGTPVPAARSGEQRAQLLARAKASPVIFLREPAPSLTANGTVLREALDQATEPAKVLASVARVLKRDRALARAVLLREGYLYFTQPALASAIVRGFTLEDLFEAAEIVVERGAEVRRAERVRWGYAWADGPDKGQHAELMLFDRVREATEPSAEPLHRDLTALRRELGFTQAEVVARAGDEVALRLAYDAASSEAVVSVAQGVVTLSCEALPTMGREQILEQRREQTLRAGALGAVWATVQQLVREGLPFDEPKTEEGQQDGKLRQEWATAYAVAHS